MRRLSVDKTIDRIKKLRRMILDSLNNTEEIECLHPLFKKAFDYLKSTDFSKVEDGKHELDGSRLYVSVVSIFGKEKKDAAIETQKNTSTSKCLC